jgi:hypothetical protein
MAEEDDYREAGRREGAPFFWRLFFAALIVALAVGWLVWVVFLTPALKENI